MNYTDLFRATLRKRHLKSRPPGARRRPRFCASGLKTRTAVAALVGVAAVAQPLALQMQAAPVSTMVILFFWLQALYRRAQAGILILTALTLLLLIDSVFTRNAGEYVACADGSRRRLAYRRRAGPACDLRRPRTLSLGLYILTAFAKSSGRR